MGMGRRVQAYNRWKIRRVFRMFLRVSLLCVAGVVISAMQVYASDASASRERMSEGWIRDEAKLLSEPQEDALEEKSEQILAEYGVSTVIVTTDRYVGSDILDWERTLFAEQKLGAGEQQSCLMLGVSMAERDWGITAYGDAEAIFGSYSREKIGGEVLEYLSDDEYYEAFDTYLNMAAQFMEDAEDGQVYSVSNPYKEKINIGYVIAGAFAVSLAGSLILVFSWKRKMNTKILQTGAGDYLKNGSITVTERSDIFLYHTVSRTRRQKQNQNTGGMHSSGNGTRGKF